MTRSGHRRQRRQRRRILASVKEVRLKSQLDTPDVGLAALLWRYVSYPAGSTSDCERGKEQRQQSPLHQVRSPAARGPALEWDGQLSPPFERHASSATQADRSWPDLPAPGSPLGARQCGQCSCSRKGASAALFSASLRDDCHNKSSRRRGAGQTVPGVHWRRPSWKSGSSRAESATGSPE